MNQLASALNPGGRSGRIDWLIALGILWLSVQLVIARSLRTSDTFPVFLIVGLLALWLFIATSIRRLHDIQLSGWFVLLYLAIPLAALVKGGIESELGALTPVDDAFRWFDLGARLALILWLALIPGSAGSNRFGPAPAGTWWRTAR